MKVYSNKTYTGSKLLLVHAFDVIIYEAHRRTFTGNGGLAKKKNAEKKKKTSHRFHPLGVNASVCFEPVMPGVGACSDSSYTHSHI